MLEALAKQIQEESDLEDAADQVNEAIKTGQELSEFYQCVAHFDQVLAATRKEGDNIKALIDERQSILHRAMDFAVNHAIKRVEATESIRGG